MPGCPRTGPGPVYYRQYIPHFSSSPYLKVNSWEFQSMKKKGIQGVGGLYKRVYRLETGKMMNGPQRA
jgi:hypothetical protein